MAASTTTPAIATVRSSTAPDSGLPFGLDVRIPHFHRLLELATDPAFCLLMIRVAGWDMALDAQEHWRCIELNPHGHSIRFA